MWQETKHGLYKQFSFHDFREAWAFMQRIAEASEHLGYFPRWQNDQATVDIWLSTHENGMHITGRDRAFARTVDGLIDPRMTDPDVIKATKVTEMQLYADGGSRGNPGPSASGYVLLDMSGSTMLRGGEYLGTTTNNQAEYQALKLGLEHALDDFQARELHVYMDSMLVINQMKNIFKIKNPELWPIHNACSELVKKFQKVTFDHVPRELNKAADAEVNKILDEASIH